MPMRGCFSITMARQHASSSIQQGIAILRISSTCTMTAGSSRARSLRIT